MAMYPKLSPAELEDHKKRFPFLCAIYVMQSLRNPNYLRVGMWGRGNRGQQLWNRPKQCCNPRGTPWVYNNGGWRIGGCIANSDDYSRELLHWDEVKAHSIAKNIANQVIQPGKDSAVGYIGSYRSISTAIFNEIGSNKRIIENPLAIAAELEQKLQTNASNNVKTRSNQNQIKGNFLTSEDHLVFDQDVQQLDRFNSIPETAKCFQFGDSERDSNLDSVLAISRTSTTDEEIPTKASSTRSGGLRLESILGTVRVSLTSGNGYVRLVIVRQAVDLRKITGAFALVYNGQVVWTTNPSTSIHERIRSLRGVSHNSKLQRELSQLAGNELNIVKITSD